MLRLTANMTRLERINELIKYFAGKLSEDAQDGTPFDCDVLDTLEKLKEKYKDDPT